MTGLLITMLGFWGATWYFVRAADRQGDNFGAAFQAIVCGAASVVQTVVYVALVFWNHRFL